MPGYDIGSSIFLSRLGEQNVTIINVKCQGRKIPPSKVGQSIIERELNAISNSPTIKTIYEQDLKVKG